MAKTTFKHLPVRLYPKQYKLLDKYARRMGESKAELVRQLVVDESLSKLQERNRD